MLDDQINASVNEVSTHDVRIRDEYDDFIDTVVGKVSVEGTSFARETDIESGAPNEVYTNVVEAPNREHIQSVDVEFAELHRIDVYIKGVVGGIKCLQD